MTGWVYISLSLALASCAFALEFKHFGDFLLQSHCKVTDAKMTVVSIKPLVFQVYTDGVQVQVKSGGSDEACVTFKIYSSDGIGRQRKGPGAIEVVPGVQAISNSGGTLRHLRLTQETMTITTFPGVSDQTSISHSVAAERRPVSVDTPLDSPQLPPDTVPSTPP
jgi:hypothetical protein